MNLSVQLKAGLYAAIVGDALGVPVESSTRTELTLCSVKNMLGYGRYDQPKGTWSDDTALTLCTMESLLKGYDIEEMGKNFCRWLFEAHWTPSGYVFDVGLTTFMALDNIRNDKISARHSGCFSEDDNGNGSIMRIFPAALFFRKEETPVFLEYIHEIGAITHSHPRAKMGCGIYSLIVRELTRGFTPLDSYFNAVETAFDHYGRHEQFKEEMKVYSRILRKEIPNLSENKIRSSGYIVETLEAAIWSFLRYNSTKDILLAAVNLGLETDTTGTLAGGIAGLYYGIDSIPADWIDSLARKAELDELIDEFVKVVA